MGTWREMVRLTLLAGLWRKRNFHSGSCVEEKSWEELNLSVALLQLGCLRFASVLCLTHALHYLPPMGFCSTEEKNLLLWGWGEGESSWPGVWVPCSANRKRPFVASVLLRQRVAGTTIMKSPLAPDEFSGKNKVLLKCRDYQISCSVPKMEKWSSHTASGHGTVLAWCLFITISHYYVFTYLFIHLCLVSVFLWADETQFLCVCPDELQSWFMQFSFRSRIQHFSGFSFFAQDTGFKCSHILLPHPF